MAQKLGRQTEWPRVKREVVGDFANPTGYSRSDRVVAGPLRMGTTPNVGPKGDAVVADYLQRGSDFGMDMIARDRKIDRKFPSDLFARQIRGPGSAQRENFISEGRKRFPR